MDDRTSTSARRDNLSAFSIGLAAMALLTAMVGVGFGVRAIDEGGTTVAAGAPAEQRARLRVDRADRVRDPRHVGRHRRFPPRDQRRRHHPQPEDRGARPPHRRPGHRRQRPPRAGRRRRRHLHHVLHHPRPPGVGHARRPHRRRSPPPPPTGRRPPTTTPHTTALTRRHGLPGHDRGHARDDGPVPGPDRRRGQPRPPAGRGHGRRRQGVRPDGQDHQVGTGPR